MQHSSAAMGGGSKHKASAPASGGDGEQQLVLVPPGATLITKPPIKALLEAKQSGDGKHEVWLLQLPKDVRSGGCRGAGRSGGSAVTTRLDSHARSSSEPAGPAAWAGSMGWFCTMQQLSVPACCSSFSQATSFAVPSSADGH